MAPASQGCPEEQAGHGQGDTCFVQTLGPRWFSHFFRRWGLPSPLREMHPFLRGGAFGRVHRIISILQTREPGRDVGKSPEATQPLSPTLGSVSSRRLAALGHRQA